VASGEGLSGENPQEMEYSKKLNGSEIVYGVPSMSLAEYIPMMTNREVSALARNRFIDSPTQFAIAEHGTLSSRRHLARNPSLDTGVRDVLVDDRANSVKWVLVEYQALDDKPDLIREVYRGTPRRYWNPWRLGSTFVGYQNTAPNTPSDVLKDIYMNYYRPAEEGDESSHFYSSGFRFGSDGYWSEKMMKHKNVNEELAVIVSTSPAERAKKAAFAKLVVLRNEKK